MNQVTYEFDHVQSAGMIFFGVKAFNKEEAHKVLDVCVKNEKAFKLVKAVDGEGNEFLYDENEEIMEVKREDS